MPANGSVGHAHRLAALRLARSATCSSASGSTCSTSTSRSCRSCRSSSCASRQSVNVAHVPRLRRLVARPTSSAAGCCGRYARRLHGRIAVSAAARHFIDRYFPGDYKVIPNGVDLDRFAARRADRALAGRHAEHPVRRPLRAAARALLVPAQGVPASCARRGCDCRLLLVGSGPAGARGAALRRHPPAARRRVPGPRQRRRARRAASRPPTSTSRRRPAASRSGSCCSRRWPPARRSSCSDIHGYKGVVRRGRRRCSCRRATPRRSPRRIARLLADRELRGADGRPRPRARRGVQLGARHRQGRRLLRLRDPPPRRAGPAARRTSPPRSRRRRGRAACRAATEPRRARGPRPRR